MKVGIVGCGPVGSWLAWKLAPENDVYVFESKKRIGGKPCSGLVSKRVWDFVPENRKIIEKEISTATINFRDKKIILRFRPKMIAINRDRFDRYVAGLARGAGAKILTGCNVERMFIFKGSKPQLLARHEDKTATIEFDRIIGADGSLSLTRKTLGLPDPKFRLGICTEVRKRSDSDNVDTYPLETGFGWRIPKKGSTEYGVIADLDVAGKEFETLSKRFRIPKASRDKRKSAIIPSGLVTTSSKYVALCGDAAGLTKPWSGGGIIWGLTAAKFLADTFPNFPAYNRKLKMFFGKKFLTSRIMTRTGFSIGKRSASLIPEKISFDSDWGLF